MLIHLIGHAIMQDPDTGAILLLKRAATDDTLPGLWEIPGGSLEFGEDPWEGKAREVLEETGIELELGSLVDYTNESDPEKNSQFVRLIFWADGFEQPVQLSKDHEAFIWVDPSRAQEYDCVPYLEEIVGNLE